MADARTDVKRHGKHYTPTELALFLAERVLAHVNRTVSLRILDPACGDGELLFAIHEMAKRTRFPSPITLVGYDLDASAVALAAARAQDLDISVELHVGDFLQVGRTLGDGSFQAIITNPPYVRTQQLGGRAAAMLAAEFGLKGRIDLTHPFVAMFSSILGAGGVLGMISSNRFLTTKAGGNVRTILQSDLQPVEIYDLGDTKIFSAAVLPAVVVAINDHDERARSCVFVSAYEDGRLSPTSSASLYTALMEAREGVIGHEGRSIALKVGELAKAISPAEPWRISSKASDEWLRRVDAATWRTFGDVAKIRVGIKTTADKVFISDSWNEVESCPEAELLLPLITHEVVSPWGISAPIRTRVLYPYNLGSAKRELVDLSLYPRAKAYLNRHADRLKSRTYVTDANRQWYEIWVPQSPAGWVVPKIVFPDISVDARFALDTSGAVVNGDCYWMSLDDIGDDDVAYLMLAVANSALGSRFYDEVCGNRLYSGRRRWMTQYVAKLPLPDPDSIVAREIIKEARSMVSAGGGRREVAARIDALVEAAFEGVYVRPPAVAESLF